MTPTAAAGLFFVEAGRALLRNRLRSTLAAFGIAIGVGAVVCMVAIGRAGSLKAEETLYNLGDNFVQIEAGSGADPGCRQDLEMVEREAGTTEALKHGRGSYKTLLTIPSGSLETLKLSRNPLRFVLRRR